MDMEFIHLMMEENIKVIILIQKNKDLENIIGRMVKHIKDNGKMVNLMEKVNYINNKKYYFKEYGKKENLLILKILYYLI